MVERREIYVERGVDRTQSPEQLDLTDDNRILGVDPGVVLKGIFGCSTAVEVEASTGFARYMSQVGCNLSTYPIYLRLLQTNNRWVVDGLIGEREARLLFTSIRPNTFLVAKAFELLSFWHPGEIYEKVLQAVMGIIENAFYDPDDGYRIYRLRHSDVNSIGKFLDETNDQFDETNSLALHVLDRITQMAAYEPNPRKRGLSKHAFDIRLAYFDDTKRCLDVIPHVLLTRLDGAAAAVRPSNSYEAYLCAPPHSPGRVRRSDTPERSAPQSSHR